MARPRSFAFAVVAAPRVTPLLTTYLKMPTLQTWIVIVAIFVAAGAVLSARRQSAAAELKRRIGDLDAAILPDVVNGVKILLRGSPAEDVDAAVQAAAKQRVSK